MILFVGTALLIEREPNNLQAQSLNQLIEKGVARGEYQRNGETGEIRHAELVI